MYTLSLSTSISLLSAFTIPISNLDLAWGIPVKLNSTAQGFRVITPMPHYHRPDYGYSSRNVHRRVHSDRTEANANERRVGGVGYTPTLTPAASNPSRLNVDSTGKSRSPSLWRWRGIVSPGLAPVSPRAGIPAFNKKSRQPDVGDPRNTVVVDSEDEYCLIVPLSMSTDIGDSEQPGGTTSYCSAGARFSQDQGVFSPDFWSVVEFETGEGKGGGRWAQRCINPETLDRLDPDDAGGQYDSNGGEGGRGNPEGSVCRGYSHYVELIEPAGARACIRCCDDPDDCPVHRDTEGCPAVIPGNYFTCDVDGGGDDDEDGERFPPQIGNGGDDNEDTDDDEGDYEK